MSETNEMSKIVAIMVDAGKVRVVYGPNDVEARVAGLTVAQVRKVYAGVIHLPTDTEALVNGQVATDDLLLQVGDRLEYMMPAGLHG